VEKKIEGSGEQAFADVLLVRAVPWRYSLAQVRSGTALAPGT